MSLIEGRQRTLRAQIEWVLRRKVAVEVGHFVNRLCVSVVGADRVVLRKALGQLNCSGMIKSVGRRLVLIVLQTQRVEKIRRLSKRGICKPYEGRGAR